jgi:hypothetical protein
MVDHVDQTVVEVAFGIPQVAITPAGRADRSAGRRATACAESTLSANFTKSA